MPSSPKQRCRDGQAEAWTCICSTTEIQLKLPFVAVAIEGFGAEEMEESRWYKVPQNIMHVCRHLVRAGVEDTMQTICEQLDSVLRSTPHISTTMAAG